MKNANGTAIAMHSTVTSAAMSSVRPTMRRYVGVKISLKFSVVNVATTLFVNGSVDRNAVAKMKRERPEIGDHQPRHRRGEQAMGVLRWFICPPGSAVAEICPG